MGAVASFPEEAAGAARRMSNSLTAPKKKNDEFGYHDPDGRLLSELRYQLSKPLDGSDVTSILDAKRQLQHLRFALFCSSNPIHVVQDLESGTIEVRDILVPPMATVANPDVEPTGDFAKALNVIGLSAHEFLKELKLKVESGSLDSFVDQDFPNSEASLAHDWSKLSNAKEWKQFKWIRISELSGTPSKKVFLEGISPADVNQGRLGNCYFLSALAVLAEHPSRIQNLFLEGSREISTTGAYGMRLCLNGVWTEVIVDDFVPCLNGRPAFAQPAQGAEFWVLLLEKAWAKVNGSYQNINGGDPSTMLQILTGAPSTTVPTKDAGVVWEQLVQSQGQSQVEAASIYDHPQDLQELVGLVERHSYAILRVDEVESEGRNVKLVQLRNPWGKFEWLGSWSDKSSKWTPKLRKQLGAYVKDDGVFFMELSDFVKVFSAVHINNVHDNWHYTSSPVTEFHNTGVVEEDVTGVGTGLSPNQKCVLKLEVKSAGRAIVALHQVNQRSLHSTSDEHGYVSMRFSLIGLPHNSNSHGHFTNAAATVRMAFFNLNHEVRLQKGEYMLCVEGVGGLTNDKFVASCYSEAESSISVLHSPKEGLSGWDSVQNLFLEAFKSWTTKDGEVHTLAEHGAPQIEFRAWRSPVHNVTCLLYQNTTKVFPLFSKQYKLDETLNLSMFNMRLAVLDTEGGAIATVQSGENSVDPNTPTPAQVSIVVAPGQSVFVVLEQLDSTKGFKAEYRRKMSLHTA